MRMSDTISFFPCQSGKIPDSLSSMAFPGTSEELIFVEYHLPLKHITNLL